MNSNKKRPTYNKVLIFLCVLLLVVFHTSLWIDSWYAIILFIGCGPIALVLLGFTLEGLENLYKTRNKKLFIPLIFSVITFLIIIYRPVYYIVEKIKSPVIFLGYCKHTVTSLSLKLRKDNTFEYDGGAFLEKDMHYGNYIIKNDTIILNFSTKESDYIKTKLILNDNSAVEIGDTLNHKHCFKKGEYKN